MFSQKYILLLIYLLFNFIPYNYLQCKKHYHIISYTIKVLKVLRVLKVLTFLERGK